MGLAGHQQQVVLEPQPRHDIGKRVLGEVDHAMENDPRLRVDPTLLVDREMDRIALPLRARRRQRGSADRRPAGIQDRRPAALLEGERARVVHIDTWMHAAQLVVAYGALDVRLRPPGLGELGARDHPCLQLQEGRVPLEVGNSTHTDDANGAHRHRPLTT